MYAMSKCPQASTTTTLLQLTHHPTSTHQLPRTTHSIHPRKTPHQRLCAHQIALPQQLRNVHIERTIRLTTRTQQLLHSLQRTNHSIRRGPRRLQQIKTDFSRLEADVRVADGSLEADFWRCVGVRRWDCYAEGPMAAFVAVSSIASTCHATRA